MSQKQNLLFKLLRFRKCDGPDREKVIPAGRAVVETERSDVRENG